MILTKNNFKSIDNVLDDLLNNFPNGLSNEFNFNAPAVNIHENKDGYHIEVSTPGLKKEDFKINLDKNLLTISYEKKTEKENKEYKTHLREFTTKSFKRSFKVDDTVNAEKIEAKYEDGILKIFLPKKEEVKVLPKEINIQ